MSGRSGNDEDPAADDDDNEAAEGEEEEEEECPTATSSSSSRSETGSSMFRSRSRPTGRGSPNPHHLNHLRVAVGHAGPSIRRPVSLYWMNWSTENIACDMMNGYHRSLRYMNITEAE